MVSAPVFSEIQRFRQLWLWALMAAMTLGLAGVFVPMMLGQAVLGGAVDPSSPPPAVAFGIGGSVLLIVVLIDVL
ncbi:MAG: hypothetical protein JRI68_04490, partial [Deltaproteobacteria bacterium]|nr:hypothetical protein [Deltaproteobacteria bacterium]